MTIYRIAVTNSIEKDIQHEAIVLSNFSKSPTSTPVFRCIQTGDILLLTLGANKIKAIAEAVATPYIASINCTNEVSVGGFLVPEVAHNGFVKLPIKILKIFKNTVDGKEFFCNARLVNMNGRKSKLWDSCGHIIRLHTKNEDLLYQTVQQLFTLESKPILRRGL